VIDFSKVKAAVRKSGMAGGRITPSPLEAAVHKMTGRQKLAWVIAAIRKATCRGHVVGDRDLLLKALRAGIHTADRHKVKGKYKTVDLELLTIIENEIKPKLVELGLDMDLNPIDESSNGSL
jgi:hypothetical protein